MFNKIKNLFSRKPVVVPEPPKVRTKRAPKPKKVAPDVDAKARATAAGEPYVAILSVDVDPENINNGQFELDFNDKFITNLIRAGYKIKESDKDSDIVDRWFGAVCRNIVLEIYEQEQADPEKRDPLLDTRIINRKPLGGGRSEIS